MLWMVVEIPRNGDLLTYEICLHRSMDGADK